MTDQPTAPYILVGVDGSAAALRAVTWAADEANSRGLPLAIASVADISSFSYGPYLGGSESAFEAIEESTESALTDAKKLVAQRYPAMSPSVIEKAGSPAAALIELSSDAYLTVVGATGLGGFSSVLLGTVALALVTNGHSPVAVIRGDGENADIGRTGPVVLGVDDSKGSDGVIGWAFDEASRRRTTLTAVHAWTDYPTGSAQAYAMSAGVDYHSQSEEQRALLSERLAGWQEKYPDVRVRKVVVAGNATDTLLHHAGDAQLVVVGSRGHGDVTGVLFGSVSRTLIHHAPCPVLVARNHTA